MVKCLNCAECPRMRREKPSFSLDFSRGFTGRLMVAMPHLVDTPFEEAVCLICSHNEDHAFGVIVNKPMKGVTLADIVSDLGVECDETSSERRLHYGGPVDMQRGAVLHSLDYRQDDTMLITSEVGLTASKNALRAICHQCTAPLHACLVMGHAGWDAGQLDEEVKRNDWLTLDPRRELIFDPSSETWSNCLHLLGINDLTRLKSGGDDHLSGLPN